VLFHAEGRRLPAIDRVAFGALTLFRPFLELSLVRIRRVAILAFGERNFFFEVVFEVASRTGHLLMLSEQGILGFGMIEIVARKHGFPTAGRVAGVARLLEFALVRIEVAVIALAKLHVLVARGSTRRVWFVALFAGYLGVESGKGVACLGVVEIFGGLPALDVVALGALIAELALMGVGVARDARGSLTKEGFGQVLIFDEWLDGGNHVRGCVAFFASDTNVLAFQGVSGQTVIELFLGRFPVNQVEVLAIVLEVAADTVFAVGIVHLHTGMVAVLAGESFRNFLMTIEAFEGGGTRAELMAGIALRGPAQRLVGLRKRTGRNLSSGPRRPEQAKDKNEQQKYR